MEHEFTKTINAILEKHFESDTKALFNKSELLQYINYKTKSANRGSKSRGSFANLYGIYVLVEDYVKKGYSKKGNYSSEYEGAKFSYLFERQRQLPFGKKLQNHALNHRLNQEFKKFFPNSKYIPIIRDHTTNRYWFNENMLKVSIGSRNYNISYVILEIIDKYISAKKDALEKFIEFCADAGNLKECKATAFIKDSIQPTVDARIFEIVSFSILKYFYSDTRIYWGYSIDRLQEESLKLYKTGRTNANDGGIDFVMKPLGRFFQVTETVDVHKYFLDIDKIMRYPITFVVKSMDSIEQIRCRIEAQAVNEYSIKTIVERYMVCIEEIINIPRLLEMFDYTISDGKLKLVLEEISRQSKVEFNYEEEFSSI